NFIGWRTDSKASEEVLEDYFVYEDTENVLYAVFSSGNDITVTTSGENAVLKEGESDVKITSKQYYNNGDIRTGKIVLPECPYEKEGMSFCGWSTDTEPNARLVPGKSENIGGANLYAKWVMSEYDFPYTTSSLEFKIPENGIYMLEVWGAGGLKNVTISSVVYELKSGLGGYSAGYMKFAKDTVLYMRIGEQPAEYYRSSYGGGGSGSYSSSTNYGYNIGGSGGGATHIALRNGNLSQLSSYQNTVLIVAGGGGSGGIIGYNTDAPVVTQGGDGGGLFGGNGSDGAMGGRQDKYSLTFGQGMPTSSSSGSTAISGGGGGWYGGYYGSKGHSGGGGSGYIGGVPDFTHNGVLYAAETKAGVNDGSGYVHIRYIKCA
ncbi:MAG: glycine-rich protein, partial [Ruminococcus sp.]|nr:glycine-rich protein [Ruminococcus sp.]